MKSSVQPREIGFANNFEEYAKNANEFILTNINEVRIKIRLGCLCTSNFECD